jgi:N-acetylmuramoyl-L-alanine amidase
MEMMRQAATRQESPAPQPDVPALEEEVVPAPGPRSEGVKRSRRRKEQRGRRVTGILGGIIRSFIVVFAAAGLTATIFTWWTPSKFITSNVRDELSVAMATSAATLIPTALPTPNWARRIGVVSGHRGPQNDPGAVCPDGLTEASINENVATMVVQSLRGRGYTVDLLDEFDPRLDNYQAAALLSIHSNTCQDFGELVSGFLISSAAARISLRGVDDLLVDCVARSYGLASGLERRQGVTVDMTNYHTFREIHPQTPAAIIELGFMLADRQILTDRTDLLANSITDGLICFLEPGSQNS